MVRFYLLIFMLVSDLKIKIKKKLPQVSQKIFRMFTKTKDIFKLLKTSEVRILRITTEY